jgi:imidazolonepropionase-like amidohydrolase
MMHRIFLFLVLSLFLNSPAFSQQTFSQETKKFITYHDNITVFKNALLIDGKGGSSKEQQTIIIENGKIIWVGDDAKAVMPKGAALIDLKGKTLMPGLVMLHEHLYISAFEYELGYATVRQLPISFPRLYLASGATTIRTCGSVEPYLDLRIKKDIDLGLFPGPTMELTAPYLDGKTALGQQMSENATPEEAIATVNYWADKGFTSFKAYININQPTLKAVIETAHKRNLKVTGHLATVTFGEAALLGIDQIEHGFAYSSDFAPNKKENQPPERGFATKSVANLDLNSESVKSLMRLLIEKKVGITSTLAIGEGFTTTQPAPNPQVLNAMSPDTRDHYLKRLAIIKSVQGPTDMDKAYVNGAKMEKLFHDMGGLLTVGTDPTGNGGILAGYGTWRAIELLVEVGGFTPLEAIKVATLNGAIALGFDKEIGTIEVGKSADVLIIDGDPSKNISDLRKVEFVFRNGVGYDSKKLFESVKGRVGFN